MKEIISKRTENSKTYNLGKDKFALDISLGVIHYKDDYSSGTEKWKDIDLTWEDNKITKAPYILEKIGNKIIVTDKKTGEISTIELLETSHSEVEYEIIPENTKISFRHTLSSLDKPFEAKFKVIGNIPLQTHAFDDDDEIEIESETIDGVLTERVSKVIDYKTKKVRQNKGNIRIDPTLNFQVGAATDNCSVSWSGSAWSLTTSATGQPVGRWSAGGAKQGGGMRFLNINMLKGMNITTAYLTLRANDNYSATTINSVIIGEDVDDAATFSDIANYQGRRGTIVGGANDNNITTASVAWNNIGAWTLNSDYNSPEIKTIVQEINNRAGWASGNDMVIFWDDHAAAGTQSDSTVRRGYSYTGSTTYAPKLHIEYSAVAPTVTTQAATDISYTTATGNGNVTSDGGDTVTERGVCWGTSANPTTAGDKQTAAGTTGAFTAAMASLTANTLYHYRAYAINSINTSYGADTEYTTLEYVAPTVTTQSVTDIEPTTATGRGTVVSDGGQTITERGVCWSTSLNPTTADTKATSAGTTGAYTVSMTSLIEHTLYHARAYAINSIGTSYGSDVTFTAEEQVGNLVTKGNTTFAVGDILRIKDGIDDEWLEVVTVTDSKHYYVTRDKAGAYGANANPTWKKGASVVNYGQSGDGGIYMTASETNAPYLSIFDHAGSPWTTINTRLRIGNLNGYLGYSTDLYGIAIGETDKYLKYDPTNGLVIKGNITATTGAIGGFNIGADYIRDAADSFGLASTVTGGNDTRFWAGDTFANRATAPFNLKENGDARVNVLTNKSIFFENTTAPTTNDGQMWAADNLANKKVLWGYFGGVATAQQVSTSKMFYGAIRDNNNTGGGSTLTYDVVVSTWFQPRSITARGYTINTAGTEGSISNGSAENGSDGINVGFSLAFLTIDNVVSSLTLAYKDIITVNGGINTMANPQIPAGIDGSGHVTSYYNESGREMFSDDDIQSFSLPYVNNYTETDGVSYINGMNMWTQTDCLLSHKNDATRANLNSYAYVLSWSDTGVTIRVVTKVGWRMYCVFQIIG
jgi:hypothetical protein